MLLNSGVAAKGSLPVWAEMKRLHLKRREESDQVVPGQSSCLGTVVGRYMDSRGNRDMKARPSRMDVRQVGQQQMMMLKSLELL